MPTPNIQHLKTLRFSGGRFEQTPGWLDFDALTELQVYQKILIETAGEEWKRRNPGFEHPPEQLKESLRLGFHKIQKGSCVMTIEKIPAKHSDLSDKDYGVISNQAVEIIDNTLIAACNDTRLPDYLPNSVISLFGDWGKTLSDDEYIDLSAGNKKEAIFNATIRKKLLTYRSKPYPDLVELTGEVLATDLKKGAGGSFKMQLENGEIIPGVFVPEQEETVTEALRNHRQVRLWIEGMAEFEPSGQLRRIKNIDRLEIRKPGEKPFDPTVEPIWKTVVKIGKSIPKEAWDDVPTDLASNLDHYLYGAPKKNRDE